MEPSNKQFKVVRTADHGIDKKPDARDAQDYLELIRTTFAHKPVVYSDFVGVLQRFKSKQISMDEMVDTLAKLFEGRETLVVKLALFLPANYEIQVKSTADASTNQIKNSRKRRDQSSPSLVPQPSPQEAMAKAEQFLLKAKKRLVGQPEAYERFKKVMLRFLQKTSTVLEVLETISEVFVDHPELREEFSLFLPDEISVKPAPAEPSFAASQPTVTRSAPVVSASQSAAMADGSETEISETELKAAKQVKRSRREENVDEEEEDGESSEWESFASGSGAEEEPQGDTEFRPSGRQYKGKGHHGRARKEKEAKVAARAKAAAAKASKQGFRSGDTHLKKARKFLGVPLQLPFVLHSLSVNSLGTVVVDRSMFHSDKYIFPVGFQSTRIYDSAISITEKTTYTNEIIDGGHAPLFRVTAKDSGEVFEGPSSTGSWMKIMERILAVRKAAGMEVQLRRCSGPKFFGLCEARVVAAIAGLEGSAALIERTPSLAVAFGASTSTKATAAPSSNHASASSIETHRAKVKRENGPRKPVEDGVELQTDDVLTKLQPCWSAPYAVHVDPTASRWYTQALAAIKAAKKHIQDLHERVETLKGELGPGNEAASDGTDED